LWRLYNGHIYRRCVFGIYVDLQTIFVR